MRVECSGQAVFRIRTTGELVTVTADELDWQEEGYERPMGVEVVHSADVEIDLGATNSIITWTLREYPQGAPGNYATEFDASRLELVQNLNFRLAHVPDDDGDEL